MTTELPAMRWLHTAMSAMLVALTVFAVLTAGPGVTVRLLAAAAGIVLVGAYAMAGHGQRLGWLSLALLAWLVLGGASPNAAYIAFSLFFLELALLPGLAGVVLVGLTWLGVLAMLAHRGGLGVGGGLGPLIGALVAVVTVRSFQALQRESERRRVLVEELEATRADLAASERHAGALEERERLAAEIHDTLAQGFTSISLLLTTAARVVDTDPTTARDLLHQARAASGDGLREARALVAANAHDSLHQTTLADALRRLGQATTAGAGLPVEVEVDADLPLDVNAQATLLRVAQSGLANVVQHAHAGRAWVRVHGEGPRVRLEVGDDGVGFDPAAPGTQPDRGYGLGVMRRRLQPLGGTLEVDSVPGRGTVLRATLPLAGRRPAEGGVIPMEDIAGARSTPAET